MAEKVLSHSEASIMQAIFFLVKNDGNVPSALPF